MMFLIIQAYCFCTCQIKFPMCLCVNLGDNLDDLQVGELANRVVW